MIVNGSLGQPPWIRRKIRRLAHEATRPTAQTIAAARRAAGLGEYGDFLTNLLNLGVAAATGNVAAGVVSGAGVLKDIAAGSSPTTRTYPSTTTTPTGAGTSGGSGGGILPLHLFFPPETAAAKAAGAEAAAARAAAAAAKKEEKKGSALPWIFGGAGVLAAIGTAVALLGRRRRRA